MRQDKKQKDRPAAALVLCFCLMAIVSVFVVKASIDKVHDNMQSEKAADPLPAISSWIIPWICLYITKLSIST